MRHIVNFGLLFSFCTLATTGVLAFVKPFSLVTTRIHVVFGFATALLVMLHLIERVKYFKSQLSGTGKQSISRMMLLTVTGVWGLLLAASIYNWQPARALVEQSYEFQNSSQIVRRSGFTGVLEKSDSNRYVARQPADGTDVGVSMTISLNRSDATPVAIAVWAETKTGTMIETLFLDETLAYAEENEWAGKMTARAGILPIWRHRYTMVSGIDPDGEVDALSGATSSHSFSLDNYLSLGEENEFVLCVEVNASADPNDGYTDPHIGQPSLWYTARIKPDESTYALLELTGHGGGAADGGTIRYDLETITSAKDIVDLLLARTERH
ncbi:MAG: DUF4405 domain-containing protein [Planctomycetota bacterium]